MTHPLEIIRQQYERAKRTGDSNGLTQLREYFLPSEHRSRPFDVGVKLNPGRLSRPADAQPYEMLVSDLLTELANAIEREIRALEYRRKLSDG